MRRLAGHGACWQSRKLYGILREFAYGLEVAAAGVYSPAVYLYAELLQLLAQIRKRLVKLRVVFRVGQTAVYSDLLYAVVYYGGRHIAPESHYRRSKRVGYVKVRRRRAVYETVWHRKLRIAADLLQNRLRRYVQRETHLDWLHLVFGLKRGFSYLMSDFQQFLYRAYVSVFFRIPRRVENDAAFVHRLLVLFVEFQRLRMRQILYRFAVEKLEILLPQIHVRRILDNSLEKLRLPRLVVLNLLY